MVQLGLFGRINFSVFRRSTLRAIKQFIWCLYNRWCYRSQIASRLRLDHVFGVDFRSVVSVLRLLVLHIWKVVSKYYNLLWHWTSSFGFFTHTLFLCFNRTCCCRSSLSLCDNVELVNCSLRKRWHINLWKCLTLVILLSTRFNCLWLFVITGAHIPTELNKYIIIVGVAGLALVLDLFGSFEFLNVRWKRDTFMFGNQLSLWEVSWRRLEMLGIIGCATCFREWWLVVISVLSQTHIAFLRSPWSHVDRLVDTIATLAWHSRLILAVLAGSSCEEIVSIAIKLCLAATQLTILLSWQVFALHDQADFCSWIL